MSIKFLANELQNVIKNSFKSFSYLKLLWEKLFLRIQIIFLTVHVYVLKNEKFSHKIHKLQQLHVNPYRNVEALN